jgi:hypothetical protein
MDATVAVDRESRQLLDGGPTLRPRVDTSTTGNLLEPHAIGNSQCETVLSDLGVSSALPVKLHCGVMFERPGSMRTPVLCERGCSPKQSWGALQPARIAV